MLTFTDPVLGDLLAQSLEPAVLGPAGWEDRGQGPGSFEGKFIQWLSFTDLAQSVTDDVTRLRHSRIGGVRRHLAHAHHGENGATATCHR